MGPSPPTTCANLVHTRVAHRKHIYVITVLAHKFHSFTSFTFKMQKSVPQLRISSSTTVTPIPLPSWLKISYIVIVDQRVDEFLPEAIEPDEAIRSGDRIIHHSGVVRGTGTVGAFMRSGNDLYALTAGHVVNDAAGTTFEIEHRVTETKIRADHLKLRHPDRHNPSTREVRILRVRTEDRDRVDPYLKRVNVHKYSGKGEAKKLDMKNDSTRGWAMVQVVQARSALYVYKEGRTTGKAFGFPSGVPDCVSSSLASTKKNSHIIAWKTNWRCNARPSSMKPC
jgi:hypothetical protein